MMNQKVTRKQILQYSVVAASVALLASCAATQTAIEHRNLETDTQLSQTIFLDPIASSQKTIYLSVKNTSQETLTIDRALKQSLKAKGYQVASNPSKAYYLLQANILKVGKMSQSASQNALGGGVGSALAGAGTGAAIGAFTHHTSGMLAGGLAGGVIGLAADSLIKEVTYTMITDLRISEKVGKGVMVHEQFQSHLNNGNAFQTLQTLSNESQYKRYSTRIVSNADRVNLKFADAKSALEQGLVKAIAEIF